MMFYEPHKKRKGKKEGKKLGGGGGGIAEGEKWERNILAA